MRYLLLGMFIFFGFNGNAQILSTDTGTIPTIFHYVEKMPEPGFDIGQYIAQNTHYPDTAIKYSVEGRVIIKFVVNEDGSVSDSRVIQSVSKECDEEALRVVRNMPAWKAPGMQDGKKVKVYFNLPIVFKLTD